MIPDNNFLIFHGKKKMMKKIIILPIFLISGLFSALFAQQKDAFFIRSIYDTALLDGRAYEWLDALTNDIGHRLSGSPGASAAVEYTRQMLDTLGIG